MKGLFLSLKGYKREYLKNDLISGLVIAAVSIPISMGYAQIAGLPAVYGLYGSLLPVLIFAVFSSSPQFIFGVDAAPAAMVGSILTGMGVALGSPEAAQLVPVLSFYTALWLLLFSLLKAGKVLNYISTPVMGGFISGICCTIILMQCPKLLGHGARSGELFELSAHLIECCADIHWLSLALGLAAGDLELAQLQLGLGAAQQQLDGHIGHGGVYRLVAKACQHFLQLVALFVQLGQHFLRFGQLVAQGGGGGVHRAAAQLRISDPESVHPLF